MWAFLGDGEMDEPEALGALTLAAREGLDNLTFVVNCNLQRLDGPVRGNGKIIQELEAIVHRRGLERDQGDLGARVGRAARAGLRGRAGRAHERHGGRRVAELRRSRTGAYIREHFFGTDPRLLKMVEDLSDEQIKRLRRGGHDYRKVYAAYAAATAHQGPADGDPGARP